MVEPYRWSQRTIPYFNAAPRYAQEVADASRAWNRSGARIRWKAVPRRHALVTIKLASSLGGAAGLATKRMLGRRILDGRIQLLPDLRKSAPGAIGRGITTGVIAHEMGHIIGLGHEPRRCAVMNTPAQTSCRVAADAPPWRYRCRILERDDVRGAIRAYGGRARPLAQPTFCDLPAPEPPTGLAARREGDSVRLSFTAPRGSADRVRISRWPGACPAAPAGAFDEAFIGEVRVTAGKPGTLTDAPFAPGRYCYAAVAIGTMGRPGRAATVLYDHVGAPPVAAFEYQGLGGLEVAFENWSEDPEGAIAAYRWDFGDGTTASEPSPLHAFPAAGTWAVTLTVTDAEGLTGSTRRDVVVAPPPE